MSAARFDTNDHCEVAGWATYHQRHTLRQRVCGWFGHQLPGRKPQKDYSPGAVERCPRCRAWLRFYNPGTHRFGSYSKDVFDAYRERAS